MRTTEIKSSAEALAKPGNFTSAHWWIMVFGILMAVICSYILLRDLQPKQHTEQRVVSLTGSSLFAQVFKTTTAATKIFTAPITE